MENRHDQEPRVDRSRLELLALLGSAGAAAACSGPAPQMPGQRGPSNLRDDPQRDPLTPAEIKALNEGYDVPNGGEGGGGGDGGGH